MSMGAMYFNEMGYAYPVRCVDLETHDKIYENSVSGDYTATIVVDCIDGRGANELIRAWSNTFHYVFDTRSPRNNPKVKRVIYNDPATIIFWTDGTKTVVKCQEGDIYSKEIGFKTAYLKKMLGNDNTFNKEINKWVPKPEPSKDVIDIIVNSLFGGML